MRLQSRVSKLERMQRNNAAGMMPIYELDATGLPVAGLFFISAPTGDCLRNLPQAGITPILRVQPGMIEKLIGGELWRG